MLMTPRYRAAAVFFAALLLGTVALVTPPGLASPSPEYIDVTRFDDPEPDGCGVNGCSLREAVAVGNERPGEQIVSFSSESKVTVGSEPIEITGDVRIIGGYPRTEITGIGQIFSVAETGFAHLERLGIADIPGNHPGLPCGVAIRNDGVATLRDVVVERISNRTSSAGVCNTGTVTIVDSSFRDVRILLSGTGGAIYNSGDATIDRSTFSGNMSTTLGGGAISNSGTMSIRDSILTDNTVAGADYDGKGGAILNSVTAELTIERTVVAGNIATDPLNPNGPSGGGIHNDGRLVLRDSAVHDNVALAGGGLNNRGHAEIERSLFTRNDGGGIFSSSPLTLTNSTVSNNRAAEFPGGVGGVTNHSTLTVSNSTIAGNTNSTWVRSGGIHNGEGGSVELANTIVADNGEKNCNSDGMWISKRGNVADDNSCPLHPQDKVVPDAGLMPLGDYGGPTELHALEPDSPAIDAGQSPCPSPDQRGAARPVNGLCDAGSYEFGGDLPPPTATPPVHPPAYPMGDANCNDRIDPGDVMAELRLTAGLLEPSFCGRDGPCVDFADKCFPQWTDTDCNGRIEPLDALRVTMHLAGETPEPPGGCAPIGQLPGG